MKKIFTTKKAYDIIEQDKNKQWGDFVNQILITGDEVIKQKKEKKLFENPFRTKNTKKFRYKKINKIK